MLFKLLHKLEMEVILSVSYEASINVVPKSDSVRAKDKEGENQNISYEDRYKSTQWNICIWPIIPLLDL